MSVHWVARTYCAIVFMFCTSCTWGLQNHHAQLQIPIRTQHDILNSSCSSRGEDCSKTKCCKNSDMTCFRKHDTWAGCKSKCDPGLDLDDPELQRSPWNCEVLGVDKRPAQDPLKQDPRKLLKPAADGKASKVNTSRVAIRKCTTDPCDTNPCSKAGEDCQYSACCEDPLMTCYRKHYRGLGWAGCKLSCSPGIDINDPWKAQQPWRCDVIQTTTTTGPPVLSSATTTTGPPEERQEDSDEHKEPEDENEERQEDSDENEEPENNQDDSDSDSENDSDSDLLSSATTTTGPLGGGTITTVTTICFHFSSTTQT